jgi:hypothetical protein
MWQTVEGDSAIQVEQTRHCKGADKPDGVACESYSMSHQDDSLAPISQFVLQISMRIAQANP